jgi:hypothetical protein
MMIGKLNNLVFVVSDIHSGSAADCPWYCKDLEC